MIEIDPVDSPSWFFIASAVSTLAAFLSYYIFKIAQKPRVYSSNERMLKLLSTLKCLDEKFFPSWFCWEGRLQSILGLTIRISSSEKLPYEREIFNLSDGGQLGLDYLPPKETNDGREKLVVLILPGMTSSSQTCYVKTLALAIQETGAYPVVFNNRGLGGVPLKTPRTYCATKTDDLQAVIQHLKSKFNNSKMIAIGTSLGGMILCNYLKTHPVEAKENFLTAMVISICWDPFVGTESLENDFVNKYVVNYGVTQNLRHLAIKYKKVLEVRKCLDFDKIVGCRTLREFDTCFTAPQFGYESVLDYYKSATVINDIHKFSIPVFGLNALDDPMQPGDHLPIKESQAENSNLAMVVTVRGGHLGFIESLLPVRKKFHFMERMVAEFVNAIRLNEVELEEN